MAIVKMKKLRLLAMSADRQALLRGAAALGLRRGQRADGASGGGVSSALPLRLRGVDQGEGPARGAHERGKAAGQIRAGKSGLLKPLPEAEAAELWTRQASAGHRPGAEDHGARGAYPAQRRRGAQRADAAGDSGPLAAPGAAAFLQGDGVPAASCPPR